MTVDRRGFWALLLAGLALAGAAPAARAAQDGTVAASDSEAPRGAVGGITSPAAGIMMLNVRASDAGAGLASAQAIVDGVVAASADLGAQEAVEGLQLPVTTTSFTEGAHQLQVAVSDAAGNRALLVDQPFMIHNAPLEGQSTALLTLSAGAGGAPAAPGGPVAPGGEVGGAGSPVPGGRPACAAPRLSVFLRTTPLRVVKGVPVLRRNARYRFSGTLTCAAPGGRRVHARSGLVVSLLNQIGRRTYRKRGVATRSDGTLAVVLAYPSSRLLDFRYMSADGTTARVRIRITVAQHATTTKTTKKAS